jgi:hypothetical protein
MILESTRTGERVRDFAKYTMSNVKISAQIHPDEHSQASEPPNPPIVIWHTLRSTHQTDQARIPLKLTIKKQEFYSWRSIHQTHEQYIYGNRKLSNIEAFQQTTGGSNKRAIFLLGSCQ